MRDIGKNIKRLRLRQRMTQDELAERLFVTRQTISNYETGKSKPDVEMLAKISEIFKIDVQQLIYGLQPIDTDRQKERLIISTGIAAVFLVIFILICPAAESWRDAYVNSLFFSLALIWAGWAVSQLLAMILRRKPKNLLWMKYARIVLVAALVVLFGLNALVFCSIFINDFLYKHELLGAWVEHTIVNPVTGKKSMATSYVHLPTPWPNWLLSFSWNYMTVFTYQNFWLFPVLGAILWLLGFPQQKSKSRQSEI